MSRYPQMSQSTAYDRSLLVGAPELTNAERQAGYNIDALERGNYPATAPPPPPKERILPPAAVDPFQDPPPRAYEPSPTLPKKSWWKSKRGRIIIGLVVIVLIGILCGIAAGAATAKNRRNATLLTAPSATSDGANVLPLSTSSISSTPSSTLTSFTFPSAPSTAPEVTRTTVSAPFGGPAFTTTSSRHHTTSLGGVSTTLPPGVTLPTATAPSSGNGGDDDDTPYICMVFPFIPDC